MKSYVQHGDVITLVAPYAVASGAPFMVGAIVAVAVNAAAAGMPVEGKTEDVFNLPKVTTQVWAVGDKIYWDDAAKLMTTTATGNKLCGAAVEATINPSTTGKVLLDGCIR